MARETIIVGSTPYDEECAQVGTPDYRQRAWVEMSVFIKQLRRQFGTEPEGCRLTIKAFPHDFGTYHEVVVIVDDSNNQAALEWAINVENNCPAHWDSEARKQLEGAKGD
jgi:hypothetical protein